MHMNHQACSELRQNSTHVSLHVCMQKTALAEGQDVHWRMEVSKNWVPLVQLPLAYGTDNVVFVLFVVVWATAGDAKRRSSAQIPQNAPSPNRMLAWSVKKSMGCSTYRALSCKV